MKFYDLLLNNMYYWHQLILSMDSCKNALAYYIDGLFRKLLQFSKVILWLQTGN